MKIKDKVISIIAILALICWLLYMVRSVLSPFIFSLIIAYFLDPLVERLNHKHKMSRLMATSLILGLFLVAIIAISAIILPIIYTQTVELLTAFPIYADTIAHDFYPKVAEALNKFGLNLNIDFAHLLENDQINSQLVNLSRGIFQNALTLVNVLSLIFITPILVFYLLKDWNVLVGKINDYTPRSISTTTKKIAKDIDHTLSRYIHGQFNVCLIMGAMYSFLLSFTGLNFGFLIGILTGLFSFIPYIGMLSGVTIAIIVALFQWGFDFAHIGAVALVFIFGQIIESNFLTPKLIGSKIGIHPVWIIFGFFIFGILFGFIGILIAVPLTATCGVIIKHFALEYKKRYV